MFSLKRLTALIFLLYTLRMDTKTPRWWDLFAALFLVCALMTAAIRLHVTNWTDNLSQVEFIILLGSLVGLLLGRSKFNGKVAFGLGLGYSLFVVPWQLASIIPVAAAIHEPWIYRLNVLYSRLWYTTSDVIRNQPVKDSILFIAAMYALYWFASLLASYALVRRANPWVPLLSLGVMVLVIEFVVDMYHNVQVAGGTYSFLYLFFCLMLMGRLYFLRSRREWESNGGTVELEVGYDLGRGVLVSALVMALLAWNVPSLVNIFGSDDPTRARISREWQDFRDRITKATNSLKSPGTIIVEGFGNNMFLGNGAALSDKEVFSIKPNSDIPNMRFYWTARNYDTYLNGQWITSISGSQPMSPNEQALRYPQWSLQTQVSFTFLSRIPLLQTLIFTGQPLRVDRGVNAVVTKDLLGESDLNALIMDPPLKSGDPYTVVSTLAHPNISAMRDASTEYPDWVKNHYLQLPENFSARIGQLAKEVAGEEKTPYDKANVITQYLRRTITYSETISPPPAGRDALEWFLFDERRGFCNYYASSEVLMLRALGVPARISVGYAQGKWDAKEKTYTVIGKDSHAWPEVYFPNLGWVVFEPTVSQPALSFPATEASANDFQDAPIVAPTLDPSRIKPVQERNPAEDYINAHKNDPKTAFDPWQYITPLTVSLTVLVLLIGSAVVFELRRRMHSSLPLPAWIEKILDERGFQLPNWMRSWSRQSLRTPMENLFANVANLLRIWGQPVEPWQTPAEQIALLVNTVPGVEESAYTLLEEYQRSMYSRYPADLARAKRAVDNLRMTGLRNWVIRLTGLESA